MSDPLPPHLQSIQGLYVRGSDKSSEESDSEVEKQIDQYNVYVGNVPVVLLVVSICSEWFDSKAKIETICRRNTIKYVTRINKHQASPMNIVEAWSLPWTETKMALRKVLKQMQKGKRWFILPQPPSLKSELLVIVFKKEYRECIRRNVAQAWSPPWTKTKRALGRF